MVAVKSNNDTIMTTATKQHTAYDFSTYLHSRYIRDLCLACQVETFNVNCMSEIQLI